MDKFGMNSKKGELGNRKDKKSYNLLTPPGLLKDRPPITCSSLTRFSFRLGHTLSTKGQQQVSKDRPGGTSFN